MNSFTPLVAYCTGPKTPWKTPRHNKEWENLHSVAKTDPEIRKVMEAIVDVSGKSGEYEDAFKAIPANNYSLRERRLLALKTVYTDWMYPE